MARPSPKDMNRLLRERAGRAPTAEASGKVAKQRQAGKPAAEDVALEPPDFEEVLEEVAGMGPEELEAELAGAEEELAGAAEDLQVAGVRRDAAAMRVVAIRARSEALAGDDEDGDGGA